MYFEKKNVKSLTSFIFVDHLLRVGLYGYFVRVLD